MLQGKLFENSDHAFKVNYFKKGKPKGKRGNITYAKSFEDVLYSFLLKELCEKIHGHDWWSDVINNEDIICHKRSNVAAYYSIIFRSEKKIICEFEIEMEVIDFEEYHHINK